MGYFRIRRICDNFFVAAKRHSCKLALQACAVIPHFEAHNYYCVIKMPVQTRRMAARTKVTKTPSRSSNVRYSPAGPLHRRNSSLGLSVPLLPSRITRRALQSPARSSPNSPTRSPSTPSKSSLKSPSTPSKSPRNVSFGPNRTRSFDKRSPVKAVRADWVWNKTRGLRRRSSLERWAQEYIHSISHDPKGIEDLGSPIVFPIDSSTHSSRRGSKASSSGYEADWSRSASASSRHSTLTPPLPNKRRAFKSKIARRNLESDDDIYEVAQDLGTGIEDEYAPPGTSGAPITISSDESGSSSLETDSYSDGYWPEEHDFDPSDGTVSDEAIANGDFPETPDTPSFLHPTRGWVTSTRRGDQLRQQRPQIFASTATRANAATASDFGSAARRSDPPTGSSMFQPSGNLNGTRRARWDDRGEPEGSDGASPSGLEVNGSGEDPCADVRRELRELKERLRDCEKHGNDLTAELERARAERDAAMDERDELRLENEAVVQDMHNEIQRLSDENYTLAVKYEEAVQSHNEVEYNLNVALAESEALRSQLAESQNLSQNHSHEADPTLGQHDADIELEQQLDASYNMVDDLQTQLDQRTAELAAIEAELDALRLENYENEQYREINADAVFGRDEQILELEEQEIRLNARIEDLQDENNQLLSLNTALQHENDDYASQLRQRGRSHDSFQQDFPGNQESPADEEDEPDPESFSDLVAEQLLRESLEACQEHRNKMEMERREEEKQVEALTAALEEAHAAQRVLELQLETSQSDLQRALERNREVETNNYDLEHLLVHNERRSDDSPIPDDAEIGVHGAAEEKMQHLNDELAQLRDQNRELIQRNVDLDQLNQTHIENSGDATIEALNQQLRDFRTISDIEQSRLQKRLEDLRQRVIYEEKANKLLARNAAADAKLLDHFLGVIKARDDEIKDLKKLVTGKLPRGASSDEKSSGEEPEEGRPDVEPGQNLLDIPYEELIQENERLSADKDQLASELSEVLEDLQQCQAHGAQLEEKLAETQGELQAANRINEARGSSSSPAQRGGRGGGRGRGNRASDPQRAPGTTTPKSQANKTTRTPTAKKAQASSQEPSRTSKRKAKDDTNLEILDDNGNAKPLDNNDKRFRRKRDGNGPSGLRGGAYAPLDSLSEPQLNSIFVRLREWDAVTAARLSDHIGYLSCQVDSLDAELVRALKDRNAVEDRLRVERDTIDDLTQSELWVRDELERTRTELKTARRDLTRSGGLSREGNGSIQFQVARDAGYFKSDDEDLSPSSVDLHRWELGKFQRGARIPGIGRDCETQARRLLRQVNDHGIEAELLAILEKLGRRIVSLRQRRKLYRHDRKDYASMRRERHRLPRIPRRRWINADGTDAEDSTSASGSSFDCGDVDCDGTNCFERQEVLRARERKLMKAHDKRVKALVDEEFKTFGESELDEYDDEPLAQRDRSRRVPRHYLGRRRSLTPSPKIGGPILLKNSPWNSAKSSRSSGKGIDPGERTAVLSPRKGDSGAVRMEYLQRGSPMPRSPRVTRKRERDLEVKVGAEHVNGNERKRRRL
ncbi:hypothetical protein AC578_5443 [Pseudocercospora eumusae]|uniref:Uncharacterized protein n=1 Tax=Pseudocercospora eumusae TaxID=321146 RepID=A0A139HK65_9PEZI|nr:hypothetical protein AC578_5443 [Pseudocercospora eumusae]